MGVDALHATVKVNTSQGVSPAEIMRRLSNHEQLAAMNQSLVRSCQRLDQQAALKHGLENVQMDVLVILRCVAQALLYLAQDVIQVGLKNSIGRAMHNGSEQTVFAGADHKVAVIFPFERTAFMDGKAGRFGGYFSHSAIHLARLGVTRRVMTGVRYQGARLRTQQEDFLDLVSAGVIKQYFLISAACHESAQLPSKLVPPGNISKRSGCCHLLGDGSAHSTAEKGFKIVVNTVIRREEEIINTGCDEWAQCFL